MAKPEGAKLWFTVRNELKIRVRDVLIACVACLSGFIEAVETVCPNAQVQF